MTLDLVSQKLNRYSRDTGLSLQENAAITRNLVSTFIWTCQTMNEGKTRVKLSVAISSAVIRLHRAPW